MRKLPAIAGNKSAAAKRKIAPGNDAKVWETDELSKIKNQKRDDKEYNTRNSRQILKKHCQVINIVDK